MNTIINANDVIIKQFNIVKNASNLMLINLHLSCHGLSIVYLYRIQTIVEIFYRILYKCLILDIDSKID
jgi:hypothetical protein